LGRERETTDNVSFASIPSPLPFKDCKVIGRERETTDNVSFAIIPSPLPFKDCKVIGEGEGNH
jgi:hypothetical protein